MNVSHYALGWFSLAGVACVFLYGFAISSEMAAIPEGIFLPPFSKDSTLKKVIVPAFKLDTYPVTTQEFAGFLKRHPEWRKNQSKPLFNDANYLQDWRDDGNPKEANLHHPVTYVSWHAAKAFCADRNARLPTTMEWERVAATRDSGYDSITMVRDILDWYGRPSVLGTSKIGAGSRNGFGVHDLHALIWEWTSDFKSWGFATLGTGRAEDSARFCGGGGNRGNSSDYILYMRYGFRSSLEPHFVVSSLGFRCAGELGSR